MRLLICILTLIHVIPIWLITYYPSQDGPCHIFNSFMLKEYSNPQYPLFREFYEINKRLLPNWFSHLTLAGLMYIFSPLVAEKVLLTAYVLLFSAAIYYFLESVERGRNFLGLFGFFFIYNYLLHMGFYNFAYSVPLYLISVGYWWRNRDHFGLKQIAILDLILILNYFCHLVSLVLSVISILFLALLVYKLKLKKILILLFSMFPAYWLTLSYLMFKGTQRGARWDFENLYRYLLSIGSMVSYNRMQYWVSVPLAIIFGLLILYTLFKDKLRLKNGRLIYRWGQKDYFLLLFCLIVLIYFIAPDGVSGGGFITTRLCLYPFLVILGWLSSDYPKVLKFALGAVVIALMLFNVGYTAYYYRLLDADMKEYVSGVDAVKSNSALLPLSFDHHGRSLRIGLFLHAVGHYGVRTGGIDLDNYEAETGYFPTKFRFPAGEKRPELGLIEGKAADIDIGKYLDTVDYVLAWSLKPESEFYQRLTEHYKLVKRNGRMSVFERKSTSF